MSAVAEGMRLAQAAERFLAALDAPLENGDVDVWSKRFESAESNMRAAVKSWRGKLKQLEQQK